MHKIESIHQDEGCFVRVSDRDLFLGYLVAEIGRSSFPKNPPPIDADAMGEAVQLGKDGYRAQIEEIEATYGPTRLAGLRVLAIHPSVIRATRGHVSRKPSIKRKKRSPVSNTKRLAPALPREPKRLRT
jgi:hypothetical protein